MSTGPPLWGAFYQRNAEKRRDRRAAEIQRLCVLRERCELWVSIVLPDYNARMISNSEVRAETIGSLLRPPYLATARGQLERGELTSAAFKKIEDRAVDEAVALQEAAGLDVVTDGEQRRYAFFGHLVEALEGFDKFGGWAIPVRDESIREGYRQRGSDPDRLIDACIELDNAIVDGHAGMTFGVHICRGNNQSMFYASGGYDRIAEQVFRRSRFHRFLLEYDDARSGTFEPLRYVPDDRVVVLGLVSTKKSRLETVDELRQRIAEASRIVPIDRLAVSPQCGFASTEAGNRISPEDQRRKLEVVAAAARATWAPAVTGS